MAATADRRADAAHVVLVVANLPIERDRRVQREAQSLCRHGFRVTVVSQGTAASEHGLDDGIDSVRYSPPKAGDGVLGFAREFSVSLSRIAWRLLQLIRADHVDIVQFCNPPDVFAPIAAVLRARGIRVVFDHHDLSPEIYRARGGRSSLVTKTLLACERLSCRTANAVIATNESIKEIDIVRNGVANSRVFVVRNAPPRAQIMGSIAPVANRVVITWSLTSVSWAPRTELRPLSERLHSLDMNISARTSRSVLLGTASASMGSRSWRRSFAWRMSSSSPAGCRPQRFILC